MSGIRLTISSSAASCSCSWRWLLLLLSRMRRRWLCWYSSPRFSKNFHLLPIIYCFCGCNYLLSPLIYRNGICSYNPSGSFSLYIHAYMWNRWFLAYYLILIISFCNDIGYFNSFCIILLWSSFWCAWRNMWYAEWRIWKSVWLVIFIVYISFLNNFYKAITIILLK